MKRIKKWFQKQDIYVILYCLCVIISVLVGILKDVLFAGLCSVFILPFLMYLLQNIMEKKQNNRSADVDIYFIYKLKQSEVIWQNPLVSESNNKTYLVVENTGHIDIYEFFIKIEKTDGGIFWWRIEDHLLTNKKCIIKIPCDCSEISKIVISGDLLTESKTKQFFGKHSCNGEKIIFSKIKNNETEKDSIIYEHGISEFIQLERVYECERSIKQTKEKI